MENQKYNLRTYQLSMEEVSLALGLINRSDMAQSLIKSIYPSITDQQMESRLISATNSLLARQLVTVSKEGYSQIGEELQMAVFPLAVYDRLIQLGSIRGLDSRISTIYIQLGRRFTCHTIEKGVLHTLEQGGNGEEGFYIQSFFKDFGKGPARLNLGKIPQDLLIRENKKSTILEAELIQNGWSTPDAKEFINDVFSSRMNGSISRINVTSKMDPDEIKQSSSHTIKLILGKKYSWVVDYSMDKPGFGEVSSVDEKTFSDLLTDFLL